MRSRPKPSLAYLMKFVTATLHAPPFADSAGVSPVALSISGSSTMSTLLSFSRPGLKSLMGTCLATSVWMLTGRIPCVLLP